MSIYNAKLFPGHAVKAGAALFSVILLVTFVVSQIAYKGNLDMLHQSLDASFRVIDATHAAEGFHASTHAMLIEASAYVATKSSRYKERYIEQKHHAQGYLKSIVSNEYVDAKDHSKCDAVDCLMITPPQNMNAMFIEFVGILDLVVNQGEGGPANDINAARKMFDTMFGEFYKSIHSNHDVDIEIIKDKTHLVYQKSSYIYNAQLFVLSIIAVVLVVFAYKVFFAAFKSTQHSAFTDALTGLKNRHYLDVMLAGTLEAAAAKGKRCGVILLDVDHFKRVNDTYGHPVGDSLLVELGQVVQGAVRKTDQVIRYGGEEFLVILDDIALEKAVLVAENVRCAVDGHVFAAVPEAPHITVSGGIAVMPDEASSLLCAVEVADQRLYRSKASGRNRMTSGMSESTCEGATGGTRGADVAG